MYQDQKNNNTAGFSEDWFPFKIDITHGNRVPWPPFLGVCVIQVFNPAPLSVIRRELGKAEELGPLAIKSTIEGLRASSVYKGKNTPTE